MEDDVRRGFSAYPRRSLVLRVLAACTVVVAAVLIKDLVLDSDPTPAKTAGARVIDWSVESELIDEELPVKVVVPPGARDGKRSLLVFLHGRGGNESSSLTDAMFEGLTAQGGTAPVVAFPQGGPDAYWHDREEGAWGSYVLEELIPELVTRFEIEPERIAIGGISMGGFGAFDLARQQPLQLASGESVEFCAVGGHSAAVWEDGSETAPGAFDDADDFAEHDVISLLGPEQAPLAGSPYWLDVGVDDPFLEANRAFAVALDAGGADGKLREGEGGHEGDYWNARWSQYMRFYSRSLKQCQQKAKAATAAAGESDPAS